MIKSEERSQARGGRLKSANKGIRTKRRGWQVEGAVRTEAWEERERLGVDAGLTSQPAHWNLFALGFKSATTSLISSEPVCAVCGDLTDVRPCAPYWTCPVC